MGHGVVEYGAVRLGVAGRSWVWQGMVRWSKARSGPEWFGEARQGYPYDIRRGEVASGPVRFGWARPSMAWCGVFWSANVWQGEVRQGKAIQMNTGRGVVGTGLVMCGNVWWGVAR